MLGVLFCSYLSKRNDISCFTSCMLFVFILLYFYRLFAALTLDIFSVGRKTKTYVTPPTCANIDNKI